MLGIKGVSKWAFETSATAGLSVWYIGGGFGSLILLPPGGGKALYRYKYLGGAFGVSSKYTTFGPGKVGVGASVSDYENFSRGKIYVLNAFHGKELTHGDFVGVCMVAEVTAGAGSVVSGTVMLMGIPPHLAEQEVGTDVWHFLMVAGYGELGQRTVSMINAAKPKIAETYSKALLLMYSQSMGSAGAGIQGGFGMVTLEDAVAPLVTREHEIPFEVGPILTRTRNTSKETSPPIVIPSDALFDFDKWERKDLKTQALKALSQAAAILLRSRVRKIIVEGHTDSIGTRKYNQGLSERRAGTVRQWLIDHNIRTAAEIRPSGYGEDFPVADNGTPEGRARNRRVVLVMTDD